MLRSFIQTCLQPFGVQLCRISTIRRLVRIDENKSSWLRNMEIRTILDIGANTGQFAKELREIFPEAMIYSFEPVEKCYQELKNNFKDSSNFQVFNLALGNQTGTIEIYSNEHSPSSSLLPMAELHKTCFPYTRQEVVQEANIARLDDIANQLELCKPLLIKVDVQGFEDQVILGGKTVFEQADIVITELSIEELYKGQKLFDAIYRTLIDLGFTYRGNYEQLYNPNDGRILQVDGIFARSNSIPI